jgi:SWI/SNF-related matrix-associated actin-dependent regulator 1 of chromatin subfamily A
VQGLKDDEEANKDAEGMGAFMQAYRLTGESKVDGVCEFIETLVDAGAKFLVFSHHQVVMDKMEAFLRKSKTGFVRIDGKVKTEERHNRV